MNKKELQFEIEKELNGDYFCIDCNQIKDFIITLFDENENIIHKCKKCYIKE